MLMALLGVKSQVVAKIAKLTKRSTPRILRRGHAQTGHNLKEDIHQQDRGKTSR